MLPMQPAYLNYNLEKLEEGRVKLVSSPDNLFQSAFQSSNSIGQFIIHDYMGIRAIALTTP